MVSNSGKLGRFRLTLLGEGSTLLIVGLHFTAVSWNVGPGAYSLDSGKKGKIFAKISISVT